MPQAVTAPASIAVRSEPMKGFDAKLEKTRTLMGGTVAMRLAAKTYLPQFEGESDDHYKTRRDMSYLFNGFKKTVFDMSGRVFEKPAVLGEDADQKFKDYAEDVDLEGRDLSTFAKTVFEAGLQSGIEYLLVDAPPKVEGETVAQATENNSRPYIIHIKPENVLGWKTKRIKNKHKLVQFRFKEKVEVDEDEYKSKAVDQIRVFDIPKDQTKVRSRAFQQNKQGQWEQVGEDAYTDMEVITVVPFYANRTDFFKGEPPLEDLADLNIAHWQSQSDQRNILHFTRVPILFASGITKDAKLKISAAQVTKASSPEADLKFVEHSGAAIGAGQKDLEHLEFQMETLGLQLVVAQNGPQTATGENRNEKKETSRLSGMADSLKDALEQCFKWMAEYENSEFTSSVNVHKDFTASNLSAVVLNLLISSVQNGKMSRKTFWAELVRRGVLPEDFDAELEQAQLDEEQEDVDGMDIINAPDDDDDDDDNDGGGDGS